MSRSKQNTEMQDRTPQGIRGPLVLLAASACMLGVIVSCALQIPGPRVVAEATAPNGTRMCVVQEFNWSFEPFTTRFLYQQPGRDWGAFYYDHQDVYWGKGIIDISTSNQPAEVFRDDRRVIEFSWSNNTYTAFWPNRTRRLQGAQWWMTPDWRPGMSLSRIARAGHGRPVAESE